ncbi:MAG TPA: anti-sigma F factor [Clostridia bacterium]|nr:anti-sigma F factor [Clostridia bacterium]
MEKINEMKLVVLSKSENLALSRVAIASFASQLDFTLSELEEIKVATSEAISNCIIHGYGDKQGYIYIYSELYEDRIVIIIEDKGKGIKDIEQARKPSFSTDPERMGLGFVFMESFMDELEVYSEPNKGTKVKLVKYLSLDRYNEEKGLVEN